MTENDPSLSIGTIASPWSPTASIEILRKRAQLLRSVRRFFDDQGFFEVQTPCLSADTVVDVFLDPPRLTSAELDIAAIALPPTLFLQTSPEYAMKRLLAAGADAIYQIGPVFRAGERGDRHNPEFTMLEWYRINETAEDAIDCIDRLSQSTLSPQPCRRLTYREAFLNTVGFDPINAPTKELVDAASEFDATLAAGLADHRDGLLDVIFSFAVQPTFPPELPHIITNYPLSQAALAQRSSADPETAERFEWFAGGVELGNGYGELLDADVLAARMSANNAQRLQQGRHALPTSSRLEAAMRCGLPPCAGVAVGFDRLLMVQQGAKNIEDVIAFPIERA